MVHDTSRVSGLHHGERTLYSMVMASRLSPSLQRAIKLTRWLDQSEPMARKVARLASKHGVHPRTIYKYVRRLGIGLPIDDHRWTAAHDQRLVELARSAPSPLTVTAAARALGCSLETIHKHAQRLGVEIASPRRWTDEQETALAAFIQDGRLTVSLKEAAKACGLTFSGLHRRLKRRGIKVRRYRPWTLAKEKKLLAYHAADMFAVEAMRLLEISDTVLKWHEERLGVRFKRMRHRKSR